MEEYAGIEHFVIDDDQKAEWALKKIREAQHDAAEWEEYYRRQTEKVKESAENEIKYMTYLLSQYFNQVPHRATKGGQEKYQLPSGELVKLPESIDYERDESKLLEWTKINYPEYIRTKETVSWADLKKHIKESGEIPDGVKIVRKDPEFKVR